MNCVLPPLIGDGRDSALIADGRTLKRRVSAAFCKERGLVEEGLSREAALGLVALHRSHSGSDSGYGKENGWDALKSYQHKRSVVVRTAPRFDDWFAGGERYG